MMMIFMVDRKNETKILGENKLIDLILKKNFFFLVVEVEVEDRCGTQLER